MKPEYSDQDIEKLLSKEYYLGAEHLQKDYEVVWTYMGQEAYQTARKNLTRFRDGLDIPPHFIQNSRKAILFVYNELNRLAKEELLISYSKDKTKEEKELIEQWCDSLSRTFSHLGDLLNDTQYL